jgi:hypothetical protein
MSQSPLVIVPCSNERAKAYVDTFHRHHGSSVQARFSVAVIDEAQLVRGVAMVGRPVARLLDDGFTLEVNRVATDGCPNACSALYGAARRVSKAMGYRTLITYTREDESGTSLRASGWVYDGPIRARSWNMPGRARVDKTEIVRRGRWRVELNPCPMVIEWPSDPNQPELAFLFDERTESTGADDAVAGTVG